MSISKKQILEHMCSFAQRPLSLKELIRQLSVPPAERHIFRRLIKQMSISGEIVKIKGHKYGLPTQMSLIVGRLQVHRDGFGFLIPEEKGKPEIYVNSRHLKQALDGDKVVVRMESSHRGEKTSGRVIRVLERAHQQIVGRYERGYRFDYVIPWHPNLTQDIFIPPQSHNAKPGQLVVAEITQYPTINRNPEGKIIEVLGSPDDIGIDEKIIIRHYNLCEEFPEQVLNESKQISEDISDTEINQRTDLRGLRLFTIDGKTARDFDDAVSIEKLAGNKLKLGVHIADVSHYVKEGSALDKEALQRGNSVYFPDRAIPMLPHSLSCGICSLNPHVDRLAVSLFIEFDEAGNLLNYKLTNSVIRSSYRFTYDLVKRILQDECSQDELPAAELIQDLKVMHNLADQLKKKRIKRGSMDFDLPEPEVIMDIDGVTQGIIKRERNQAHELIEEFMLMANEVAAGYLTKAKIPMLYRIHEEPDEVKLREFLEYLTYLGYKIKPKTNINQHELQEILNKVKDNPLKQLIALVMLRALKLAKYSVLNIGHFALAAPCYTHFTSPIRRYPDLVIHRLLKQVKSKTTPSYNEAEILLEKLSETARHCSLTERVAENAERDIMKIKRVKFMHAKVGEEFEGIISRVTSFGLFVELTDFYLEGLIHVSSMTDDYYQYNDKEQSLIGKRTKRKFCLGERLKVRVDNVNIERRLIDFALLGKAT